MKYKALWCLFILCLLGNVTLFSEGYFYKDAKVYLDYAYHCFLQENWQDAYFYAERGVNNDASLSDLWYIMALSADALGKKKYVIVNNLERSLKIDSWLIFDKSKAVLALAKNYLQTNNVDVAKKCLDAISSQYFNEKRLLQIEIAYLEKDVFSARKYVAEMANFSKEGIEAINIFLHYEAPYYQKDAYFDVVTNFITNNFERLLTQKKINVLQIFPYGEIQKIQNFLKSQKNFTTKSFSYLLALYVYDCLTFEELVMYAQRFSQKELSFSCIQKIIAKQKSFEISKIVEFLKIEGFDFLFDTNKDSYSDVRITYKEGIIKKIAYEENQDGIKTWQINFDSENPTLTYAKNNRKIVYDIFPEVKSVKDTTREVFFVDNSVFYNPIVLQEITIGENWMIENPLKLEEVFSFDSQEKNISVIHSKTSDTSKSHLYFNQGILQFAEYFSKNKKESRLFCHNGKPLYRKLDLDYDGYFEIIENFSSECENNEDYRQVLFGPLAEYFDPIFLKHVDYTYNF